MTDNTDLFLIRADRIIENAEKFDIIFKKQNLPELTKIGYEMRVDYGKILFYLYNLKQHIQINNADKIFFELSIFQSLCDVAHEMIENCEMTINSILADPVMLQAFTPKKKPADENHRMKAEQFKKAAFPNLNNVKPNVPSFANQKLNHSYPTNNNGLTFDLNLKSDLNSHLNQNLDSSSDSQLNLDSDKNVFVVLFYTTWCGESIAFLPIWNDFKLFMNANSKRLFPNKTINLIKVDCELEKTKHKNLCKLFTINSYPTIKLLHNSKKADFINKRTLYNLINFLKENL